MTLILANKNILNILKSRVDFLFVEYLPKINIDPR